MYARDGLEAAEYDRLVTRVSTRRATRMRRGVGIALVLMALLAAGWRVWPLYQFYAHKGALPLPPTGWQTIGTNPPRTEQVHDEHYRPTGVAALAHLETWRSRIQAPAFSAAVAVDGRPVWAGAVGWADIGRKQSATPGTRFRIGSTSKALTGIALARLVDGGRLDLDAPIETYLRPLPNPAWATITARQLASHSSGLPHYKENTEFWGRLATVTLRRHFTRMADALTLFDESALLFTPGTKFHYSSLGTVVLGAVIARAEGRTYLEVMHREVFEPAGMRDTQVAPPTSEPGGALATFYVRRGDRHRPWRAVDLSHRLPGGGFASTPTDLVRFGMKVLEPEFLSLDVRRAFWTPQRLADGRINPQAYALGWRWRRHEVDGLGTVAYANHGGVSRGSQCWLMVAPELGMAVAMAINVRTEHFGDFSGAWKGLLRLFAERHRTAVVDR